MENGCLRVLDIGNSYTVNSTCYLRELTEDLEVDDSNVCMYRSVFSGGTFKNWVDVYNDRDTTGYYIQKVFGGLSCSNINESASTLHHGSAGLKSLLDDNEWDLVIIHQASRFAPFYESWQTETESGYLSELMGIIKDAQPQAAIGTHIVHSYGKKSKFNTENLSTEKRWRYIAASVWRMTRDFEMDVIIPYGTVIEILRASDLNDRSDLLADGTHLNPGLPCYAANCCYYETVFAPYFHKSMENNTFRPEGSPSVTDENAEIVWTAVSKACANPYQIEDSPESGIKARVVLKGTRLSVKNVSATDRIIIYSESGQVLEDKSRPGSESKSGLPHRTIKSMDIDAESVDMEIELPSGLSIVEINGESLKVLTPRKR